MYAQTQGSFESYVQAVQSSNTLGKDEFPKKKALFLLRLSV